MLGTPKVLTKLDGDTPTAHHIGDVFTVSHRGCKRRAELVLATDRVGLEIHDVRSSRVVSSHGIPPADLLVCRPVSVVVRRSQTGKGLARFTYWIAARDGFGRIAGKISQLKLHCLYEYDGQSQVSSSILSHLDSDKTASRFLLPLNQSSEGGNSAHSLLMVCADGSVDCFSATLERTLWSDQLLPQTTAGLSDSIKLAAMVGENDARVSLLKSRADVAVAMTSANSKPDYENQLLVVVQTPQSGPAQLRYLLVNNRLSEISKLKLPAVPGMEASDGEWSLHPKSGQLYRTVTGTGVKAGIYDLSGLYPTVKHVLNLPLASSIMRISPKAAIIAHGNIIQAVSVKWQSLLDEAVIQLVKDAATAGDVEVVVHFPSLSKLIVIQDSRLLAMDVLDERSSTEPVSKKRKLGTLADAVRRGIGAVAIPSPIPGHSGTTIGQRILPSTATGEFLQTKKSLDKLRQNKSIESYDKEMLKALDAEFKGGDGQSALLAQIADSEVLRYAVNGLFTIGNDKSSSSSEERVLEVKSMAPETFRVLLTRGYLTVTGIADALRLDRKKPLTQKIRPAAVVDALAAYDPSLQVLIYYLSSAPLLSAAELVAALLYALRVAQRAEHLEGERLHADQEAQSFPRSQLANEDLTGKAAIAHVTSTAQKFDGDWPDPDPLEDEMHNARSALGSCLSRLYLCDDRDICKAFQNAMSRAEILMLVDYVRIELASGGWLARLVDEELEGETDLSAQTSQVNVMAKMLNCAVDSLGSTAWFLAPSDETISSANAHKIEYMRAEVNAALEGIEESSRLERMLNETLLLARSTSDPAQSQSQAPGSIITLPSPEEERLDALLPLSQNGGKSVQKTKVVRGEDVARSKRDIAWQRQHQVPEYSFQRISI